MSTASRRTRPMLFGWSRSGRPLSGRSPSGWALSGWSIEWLVALLASLALATLAVNGNWSARLDHLAYDGALRLRSGGEGRDILIVAIDDASLAEVGAWPWPRQTQAELVRRLAAARPRAIGLDLLLSEPRDAAGDAAMAAVLAGAGRVVLPVAFEVSSPSGGPFRVREPLPAFCPPNVRLGHVNLSPDGDGIARRFYQSYSGRVRSGSVAWQSLPAMMLGPDSGSGPPQPMAEAVDTLVGTAPLLVDWLGPPGTVPTVSAAAVLRGEVPPELIAGREVLVGVTAAGLGDYHATPVATAGALMAGVELQGNLLATLRSPRPLRPAPVLANYAVVIVPLILAFLALRRLPSAGAGLIIILLAAGVAALSSGLLRYAGVWLPPVTAIAALALAWPLWAWRRLAVASRYARRELERSATEAGDLTADVPAGPVLDRQLALIEAAGLRERRLRRA